MLLVEALIILAIAWGRLAVMLNYLEETELYSGILTHFMLQHLSISSKIGGASDPTIRR